ncbi:hypothetical protein IT571_03670 [Candidatus Sumerlaeota bacterium]|nr:hypothetical protein [Candidatus Sumerlaeota bacterium]
MNTALVGGRYWSIVDVVLIVALGSLTIVGTINYPLRILPWTYIGIMIFGPFWITIRTTPAIRRAASPIMRELFATTHKPAEWFVNLIVGRAMWRGLWPVALMVVQCILICIIEGNRPDIIAVTTFCVISLAATICVLCALWDQLHHNIAPEESRARLLASVMFWKVLAMGWATMIPIVIFGGTGFRLRAYILVFAPLVITVGVFVIRGRYRAAVAKYFQFE